MSATTRSDTEQDTGWSDDDSRPVNRDAQPEDADSGQILSDDPRPGDVGTASETGGRSLPSRSRHRRAGGADLDRASVRRVLDRQAAVRSLASSDLEMVAGLLGTEPDVNAVTESSLVAGKAGTAAALHDLDQLAATASDMDALLQAIEMGPERVRTLNALVGAVSGSTSPRLHASHAKAARQVVLLVRGLDGDVRGRISGLARLLG